MNASPPLASRLVSRNALRPLARALAAGLLAAALPAGGIVEAYYHPVTGQLVRETRFGQERPATP